MGVSVISYNQLRKGRHSESGRCYHVITRLRGKDELFHDFVLSTLFAKTLHGVATERDIGLLCWVLMPDHFHALIQLKDRQTIGDCIMRIKGRSARVLNQKLNRTGPLWQKTFYERALRREDDTQTVARYIVANPIRAGLVKRAGDYPFWDAVWL